MKRGHQTWRISQTPTNQTSKEKLKVGKTSNNPPFLRFNFLESLQKSSISQLDVEDQGQVSNSMPQTPPRERDSLFTSQILLARAFRPSVRELGASDAKVKEVRVAAPEQFVFLFSATG